MLLTKVIVLQENTYLEVLFVVLCMSSLPLEVHIFWTHTEEYNHELSLRIVSVEMFKNIYPCVEWRPKPFQSIFKSAHAKSIKTVAEITKQCL